ncbi:MAG: VWA domain-containing protein [Gemmatimonadota bacterium]|nr:MAG: VWA domain-containing protein [Gemmatimonadota bacterium]
MYRFEDPWYLLLLAALPALVYAQWRHGARLTGTLRHSNVAFLRESDVARTGRHRHVLLALRLLALAGLILAFARPQTGITSETLFTEGIDIVLVMDVSSSMLAEDLQPNRLEASKAVAAEFVGKRTHDRIGLVVFAGEAFTQAPLTLDYSVITDLLSQMEVGMIEDGTAVGMGLATAVKRLQASKAESKVVVLLTDGRSNRGEIGPMTAAGMAQALGVKVYTVGAGTRGVARVPVDNGVFGRRYANIQADVDEATLEEIADLTGGRYFRAADRDALSAVYQEINDLETTEIEVRNFTRYGELFYIPLSVGLLFLVLEVGLGQTLLRKLP